MIYKAPKSQKESGVIFIIYAEMSSWQ